MKILLFAYREWAKKVYEDLTWCQNNLDIKLCTTNEEILRIPDMNPDIIFFVGWSDIIPDDIIEKYDCYCMHPSPLPKYRGGSPIQNQIINGEKTSAVTIFKMTSKLDAGPIAFQKSFDLSGSLENIFDRIEAATILGILAMINNPIKLVEQNEDESTYFKRRKPSQSEIDITDFEKYDAEYFYNLVRCLQPPYPRAYIRCKDGTKLYLNSVDYE